MFKKYSKQRGEINMDFKLSSEEKEIIKKAKDFIKLEIEPLTSKIEKENDYPEDLMKKMANAGFLGISIPEEYGGRNHSNLVAILIAEELGKAANVCAWPTFMNNSVAETLYYWGPEHVRKKYIPPLCNGTAIGSLGFTEPETGSDPRMIKTTAKPEGNYYILNGVKRYVTNGNKPGYGLFFAKDETGKITAFVLEKLVAGYKYTKPWRFMGLEGMNCVDVVLRNVKVPKENIVGKKGDGFRVLLRWISTERIQQAGYMVGIGQAAIDESIKFMKKRKAGSKRLAQLQGFQWMIAEMQAKVDACRLMTYRAACAMDEGEPFQAISAEVKIFVVPTIQEVVRMALQIHGSYGYTKGFKVERLYRYAAHAGVTASSTEINKTIVGTSLLSGRKEI
jgi:butyryl-CoA dehydrogenase